MEREEREREREREEEKEDVEDGLDSAERSKQKQEKEKEKKKKKKKKKTKKREKEHASARKDRRSSKSKSKSKSRRKEGHRKRERVSEDAVPSLGREVMESEVATTESMVDAVRRQKRLQGEQAQEQKRRRLEVQELDAGDVGDNSQQRVRVSGFVELAEEGEPEEEDLTAAPAGFAVQVDARQQPGYMVEVVVNDRLGKKVRVKANSDDTIEDFKKVMAVHAGTQWDRIRLQRSRHVLKDPVTLDDYEVHDGCQLDLFYTR